jgi:hypothetical protein
MLNLRNLALGAPKGPRSQLERTADCGGVEFARLCRSAQAGPGRPNGLPVPRFTAQRPFQIVGLAIVDAMLDPGSRDHLPHAAPRASGALKLFKIRLRTFAQIQKFNVTRNVKFAKLCQLPTAPSNSPTMPGHDLSALRNVAFARLSATWPLDSSRLTGWPGWPVPKFNAQCTVHQIWGLAILGPSRIQGLGATSCTFGAWAIEKLRFGNCRNIDVSDDVKFANLFETWSADFEKPAGARPHIERTADCELRTRNIQPTPRASCEAFPNQGATEALTPTSSNPY